MWGRGRVAGLALAAALSAAGTAAAAAPQAFDDANVPARLSGGVTVVWHANPAACGAHGLCAFSGSIVSALGGEGDADVTGAPGRAFPDALDVDQPSPAIVRARRAASGGPVTCIDSIDDEPFLQLVPAANGRVAIPLAQPGFGALLSSGRCAGPLPADLPRSLLSRPVDSRQVGRRPVTIDFSGRTPMPPGLFAGELVSTLKVTIGRAHLTGRGERTERGRASLPPRRRRGPRFQVVSLEYGVESVTGGLSTNFAGLPGPGCAPLDACASAGGVGYSLDSVVETVFVFGRRRARGNGGGLGSALLALRQGKMNARVEADSVAPDDSASRGTASARVTLPDGTVCEDSVTGPAPPLEASGRRGHMLELRLGSADQPGLDAVRTRCPGPAQPDLSGGGALAAGALDARTLGQPRIDLSLRTGGLLSGPGYAGSRSGEIVLHLRLRHAAAQVVR